MQHTVAFTLEGLCVAVSLTDDLSKAGLSGAMGTTLLKKGVPIMKKSHLTPNDRTRIETPLSEGCSIHYITDRLDRAPSTISREINKHICFIQPRAYDCIYFRDCPHSHVCGASSCRKSCRTCQKAKSIVPTISKPNATTSLNPLHMYVMPAQKRVAVTKSAVSMTQERHKHNTALLL